MKKLILSLAAVLLLAAACVPGAGEPEHTLGKTLPCPWDANDTTLHTFIVAGQSNMKAAGGDPAALPPVYTTGIDELQMFHNGEWKRLAPPTGQKWGPEISFAWTMHAACPNANIGIVKHAVGGTSIDKWVPTGVHGEELRDIVTDAYTSHPDVTFEGFLFQQGGADMQTREKAESWGEDYVSIVDFARSSPGVANNLPFIHGTYRTDPFPDDISDIDPDAIPAPIPGRPFAVHLLVEQWNVQNDRPAIYPTVMRDLPVLGDGIHWTPEGIRNAGRNFAERYANDAN